MDESDAAAASYPPNNDRLAPILPEDPKHYIGENASVHGLVEQLSFSKRGSAFLNFGGECPRHVFTGFVSAHNVDAVEGQKFLQSLAGNSDTLSGKIELYTLGLRFTEFYSAGLPGTFIGARNTKGRLCQSSGQRHASLPNSNYQLR